MYRIIFTPLDNNNNNNNNNNIIIIDFIYNTLYI